MSSEQLGKDAFPSDVGQNLQVTPTHHPQMSNTGLGLEFRFESNAEDVSLSLPLPLLLVLVDDPSEVEDCDGG